MNIRYEHIIPDFNEMNKRKPSRTSCQRENLFDKITMTNSDTY